MIPTLLHYFLHLGFPALLAYLLFRDDWKRAYLILLATMLIDADHLLADPVFAANRCSIGFHPLHTGYAAVIYLGLLWLPRPFNIIGVGLLFHLATDFLDCGMTYTSCAACLEGAPAGEWVRWVWGG